MRGTTLARGLSETCKTAFRIVRLHSYSAMRRGTESTSRCQGLFHGALQTSVPSAREKCAAVEADEVARDVRARSADEEREHSGNLRDQTRQLASRNEASGNRRLTSSGVPILPWLRQQEPNVSHQRNDSWFATAQHDADHGVRGGEPVVLVLSHSKRRHIAREHAWQDGVTRDVARAERDGQLTSEVIRRRLRSATRSVRSAVSDGKCSGRGRPERHPPWTCCTTTAQPLAGPVPFPLPWGRAPPRTRC